MLTRKRRLFAAIIPLCGLLLGVLLAPAGYATGQDSDADVDVFFRVNLPADSTGLFDTLYATLRDTLTAEGISTLAQSADPPAPDTQPPPLTTVYPVLVDVYPSATGDFQVTIQPRPPQDSVFSPVLEAAHVALTLEPVSTATPPALISDLISVLYGYSESTCDLSRIAALRTNTPAAIQNPHMLDYVEARCHYQARDYTAAINLLETSRDSLEDHKWLPILWDAATAQALAQNFQFDAALALDDALIQQVSTDPLAQNHESDTSELLAELHLLRGQHRLYLYEWDTVMADYDTAIGLAPDLSRAYFLRGLLNSTQNHQQAALDDLTSFLQLERSRITPTQHPAILAQAEIYVTALEALLATPPAD